MANLHIGLRSPGYTTNHAEGAMQSKFNSICMMVSIMFNVMQRRYGTFRQAILYATACLERNILSTNILYTLWWNEIAEQSIANLNCMLTRWGCGPSDCQYVSKLSSLNWSMPKPGLQDDNDHIAWSPISLTSFLLSFWKMPVPSELSVLCVDILVGNFELGISLVCEYLKEAFPWELQCLCVTDMQSFDL